MRKPYLSDIAPKKYQSKLHPVRIWYILLTEKHRSQHDMMSVYSYNIYDEDEAKEFARKHRERLIFFGEYTLSKQFIQRGKSNGSRSIG